MYQFTDKTDKAALDKILAMDPLDGLTQEDKQQLKEVEQALDEIISTKFGSVGAFVRWLVVTTSPDKVGWTQEAPKMLFWTARR